VVPPRSGEINLRLYGANATDDTLSAVALLDSLFYNNAVRVVARFDAIEDTLADFSNIVSSSLDSALWISRAGAAGDTPDNYFTITIDADSVSGTADLINFPVLLTADNFPDEAKDSDLGTVFAGGGIRFVDAVGDTLPREIVDFTPNSTPGSATAEIWVLVDTLSYNNDTVITCAYFSGYSEPDSSDTYGMRSVWADYNGVWHLNDLTTTTVLNSSSLGIDGVKIAANVPNEVAGKIGQAQDFDVSAASYINVTDSAYNFTGDFTFSAWINAASVANNKAIFNKRLNVTYQYQFRHAPSVLSLLCTGGSVTGSTTISTSTWYHVSCTRDADGNTVIYLNGESDGSDTSDTITTQALSVYIGYDGGQAFDGVIDNMMVLDEVRSGDWIATEYSNQNTPATFAIEGALQ